VLAWEGEESEEDEPKYRLSETAMFFPWGSINSMSPLFNVDEEDGSD